MTSGLNYFSAYENNAIIISPNIGFPIILSRYEKGKIVDSFKLLINIIAPQEYSLDRLKANLTNFISIIPLYEHDPTTQDLIRGQKIPVEIISLEVSNSLRIQEFFIQDLYSEKETRQSYILRHNFFGDKRQIFWGKIGFSLKNAEEKCIKWLDSHRFLMFDLIQYFPETDIKICRICYHSVVISNSKWNDLSFCQISDLHIAKRYDEILGMLQNKMKISSEDNQKQSIWNDLDNIFKTVKRTPLIERYLNPNNAFRRFIMWANQKVMQGEIDCIFITGDIIDFCLKSSIRKTLQYDLEDTNWEIFLNIILNRAFEIRPDCKPRHLAFQQELAGPIFTITGNHDVRVNGYPLTATGIYKHFGLNAIEANLYRDPFRLGSVKSLVIDKYCLQPYYQFINPFDDYFVDLGTNHFICLNSGQDSFLSMKSLLMANPSSVGFSDKQFRFAVKVAENCMQEYGETVNNFIVSHAPVFNPIIKGYIIRTLLKYIHSKKWENPESFKERNLLKNDIKDPRADIKLDFTYGTIAKHWIDIVALIFRYQIIALAGHTHMEREFRFTFSGEESEIANNNGKINKNPFAIYWDDYSHFFTKEELQKNRPFILQTPSLGIRRVGDHRKNAEFRWIKIKDQKIQSIQVIALNQLKDFKPIYQIP